MGRFNMEINQTIETSCTLVPSSIIDTIEETSQND
jgi:hypothetical protein